MSPVLRGDHLPLPVERVRQIKSSLAADGERRLVTEAGQRILFIRVAAKHPDPITDLEPILSELSRTDIEALTHIVLLGGRDAIPVDPRVILPVVEAREREDRERLEQLRDELWQPLAYRFFRFPGDAPGSMRLAIRAPDDLPALGEPHFDQIAEALAPALRSGAARDVSWAYVFDEEYHARVKGATFVSEVDERWRRIVSRRVRGVPLDGDIAYARARTALGDAPPASPRAFPPPAAAQAGSTPPPSTASTPATSGAPDPLYAHLPPPRAVRLRPGAPPVDFGSHPAGPTSAAPTPSDALSFTSRQLAGAFVAPPAALSPAAPIPAPPSGYGAPALAPPAPAPAAPAAGPAAADPVVFDPLAFADLAGAAIAPPTAPPAPGLSSPAPPPPVAAWHPNLAPPIPPSLPSGPVLEFEDEVDEDETPWRAETDELARALSDAGFQVVRGGQFGGLRFPVAAAKDAGRPDEPRKLLCYPCITLTEGLSRELLAVSKSLGVDLLLVVTDTVDPAAERAIIATNVKVVTPLEVRELDL